MTHHIRTLPTAALLVAMIAGCGGGGGGGSNPTATQAEISPDNATEIAGDVVEGVTETAALGEFGAFGGLAVGGALPGGGHSKTTAALASKTGGAVLMQAAIGPVELTCANGGKVTISAEIREQDTLSAGDTFTFEFDRCDEGEGEILSGRVRLGIDAFEGDLDAERFRVDATLDFDVLAVEEDGQTDTVNGELALSVDTTRYPTVSFSHASDAFSVTEDGETVVLADWLTRLTVDESSQPPAYALTGNGSIDVPRHGAVGYEFLEPFQGFGEDRPDSGVLLIEGANGGSIRVTALSNTQVQLEIDYDGLGVDETLTLTWDEIDDPA
jgi:hypothetical protein